MCANESEVLVNLKIHFCSVVRRTFASHGKRPINVDIQTSSGELATYKTRSSTPFTCKFLKSRYRECVDGEAYIVTYSDYSNIYEPSQFANSLQKALGGLLSSGFQCVHPFMQNFKFKFKIIQH